jgi:hypothetical protein
MYTNTAYLNAVAIKNKLETELAEVNEFLRLYVEFSDVVNPTPVVKVTILDVVVEYLLHHQTAHIQTLMSVVLNCGKTVGGPTYQKQVNNLSSALSRDKRFVNDRKLGWRLQTDKN